MKKIFIVFVFLFLFTMTAYSEELVGTGQGLQGDFYDDKK